MAPGRASELLGSLPVSALRLASATVDSLHDVGIERFAQLASKPRASLQNRFGSEVLLRMDQALGSATEVLISIVPPEVPRSKLRFAEPIATPVDLQRVISILCRSLAADLEQRGVGARRLDLVFTRVDNIAQAVRIGTSRPNRNAAHLAKLLSERLVLASRNWRAGRARAAAELCAALLGHGERRLCPGADHAGLKLRYRDHLLQQKAAGSALDLQEIGEANINTGFKQPRQERDRSRQAVDLADDQ